LTTAFNNEQANRRTAFHSSFLIPRSSFLLCPSLFPQHQIHHPAAADMRSRSAAMAQDVLVATARFRKGVGLDSNNGFLAHVERVSPRLKVKNVLREPRPKAARHNSYWPNFVVEFD